jgi:hypothetical protein
VPVGNSTQASAVATCPSGTNVIGGGANVSTQDGFVNDSYPTGTSGWAADFYNSPYAANTITGTVTAICAPAAATTGS